MKIYAVVLLLFLLIACSNGADKERALSLNEQMSIDLKFNTESSVEAVASSKPGFYDVTAIYPLRDYDPASGTTTITNGVTSSVDIFLGKGYQVAHVTVKIYNNDKYIGVIEIDPVEFQKIKASGLNVFSYVGGQLKLDQETQVRINIKHKAKSAKDIEINKRINETTNETIIDISFKLQKEPILADWQKKTHPLYDIDSFELLVSDIVKLTFESDESIDRVYVKSEINEQDSRWNDSLLIGEFEMDRLNFEEIVDKWDDLRYNIYEDIVYSPVFLLDYKAHSSITGIEFGEETIVDAYYEDRFESIDNSMDIITKDCDEIIESIFEDYEDVDEVTVKFKAKVPAREGEVSSDGVHSIIKDIVVVKAQRDMYLQLLTAELTPIQTLFNFEVTWHDRTSELMILDNMFSTPKYFRSIEFGSGQREVTLTLDSCLFEKDLLMKQYVVGVRRAIALGNTDVSLEEEIYNQASVHIQKLFFDFHPPFLETVNFYIERVYLDTTGHEIDVKELGILVFEKQEEANYWFQTEHPDDLEWIIEIEDDLDIDDDEVLCQE